MQSSTADANCYDFIGSGRERERDGPAVDNSQIAFLRAKRYARGSFFFIFVRHHFDAVEFSTAATWGRERLLPFRRFPLKAPGYIVPPVLSYLAQVCPQVKLSGSIESSPRASPDNSPRWELTVACRRDPEYSKRSLTSIKRESRSLVQARLFWNMEVFS